MNIVEKVNLENKINMSLRKTIFGKYPVSQIMITDLVISTQYASAIKLTFTPPVMENPVSHYKVFISGVYYSDIISPGDYVVDLSPSTSYTITTIAVDTLGNQTAHSNQGSVTTASVLNYPGVSNMVSYWKMDGDANDSVGINNGTIKDVSFVPGVVNTGAHFDAVTSEIKMADNDSLSFTDGTNDKPFSITFFFKLDAQADISKTHMFIVKGFIDASTREYTIAYVDNTMQFRLFSDVGNTYIYTQCSVDFTPNTDEMYSIECTYDGSGTKEGQNVYISAIKMKNIYTEVNTYSGMVNRTTPLFFGRINDNGSDIFNQFTFDGLMDQIVFWNLELNQGQISDIRHKQRILNQHLI